ncbi:MAG: hypothetical protein WCK89_21445, partial [bacterium]
TSIAPGCPQRDLHVQRTTGGCANRKRMKILFVIFVPEKEKIGADLGTEQPAMSIDHAVIADVLEADRTFLESDILISFLTTYAFHPNIPLFVNVS